MGTSSTSDLSKNYMLIYKKSHINKILSLTAQKNYINTRAKTQKHTHAQNINFSIPPDPIYMKMNDNFGIKYSLNTKHDWNTYNKLLFWEILMGRNFSQYALKSFFDIKLVQVKRGGGEIKMGERERKKRNDSRDFEG